MTSTTTAPLTVPPLRLEPAYTDRDAVWQTLLSHAPYPLMSAGKGYGAMMSQAPLEPWFRSTWAVDGRAIDDETQAMVDDPVFIQAAKDLYGAEIVRPQSLIVNVMGPQKTGARHVDVATFRGFRRAEAPIWLLMIMGLSGLFDEWTVRVAGVLTWFYEGADGEYEYWPNGVDAPSAAERGPFGNVAIVGDNDLMYHRVGAIGDADEFNRTIPLVPDSTIRPTGDHWEVTGGDSVIGTLPNDQVRISLLWRAIAFRDEREAAAFDSHEDELEIDVMVERFREDLARRGVDVVKPDDPFNDPDWAKALTSTYLMGAQR